MRVNLKNISVVGLTIAAISKVVDVVVSEVIGEQWKNLPIRQWIVRAFAAMWGWFQSERTVGVWYLLLLCVVAGGATVWLARALLQRGMRPAYLDYREDTFFGIRWQWDYAGTTIDELSFRGYCPRCHLQLRFVDSGMFAALPKGGVQCPECGYSHLIDGNLADFRDRIARMIDRKIRAQSATTPALP